MHEIRIRGARTHNLKGVDLDLPRDKLIVFTGQMDYRPNVEAVTWFVEAVLPHIRLARPNARFVIVGRSPVEAVRALGRQPGVTVTGEVADVRGWLAAASVVVAPLKLARGVQNKVLEAMGMARPLVADPLMAASRRGRRAIRRWPWCARSLGRARPSSPACGRSSGPADRSGA